MTPRVTNFERKVRGNRRTKLVTCLKQIFRSFVIVISQKVTSEGQRFVICFMDQIFNFLDGNDHCMKASVLILSSTESKNDPHPNTLVHYLTYKIQSWGLDDITCFHRKHKLNPVIRKYNLWISKSSMLSLFQDTHNLHNKQLWLSKWQDGRMLFSWSSPFNRVHLAGTLMYH